MTADRHFRPRVICSTRGLIVLGTVLVDVQLIMAGAFVINTFNDQVLMFSRNKSDRGVLVFTSEVKANAYIGERQLEPMSAWTERPASAVTLAATETFTEDYDNTNGIYSIG